MPRIDGPVRGVSPCKGCTRQNKKSGCHDSCREYMAWKEQVEQVNKARRDYVRAPKVVFTDFNKKRKWKGKI